MTIVCGGGMTLLISVVFFAVAHPRSRYKLSVIPEVESGIFCWLGCFKQGKYLIYKLLYQSKILDKDTRGWLYFIFLLMSIGVVFFSSWRATRSECVSTFLIFQIHKQFAGCSRPHRRNDNYVKAERPQNDVNLENCWAETDRAEKTLFFPPCRKTSAAPVVYLLK